MTYIVSKVSPSGMAEAARAAKATSKNSAAWEAFCTMSLRPLISCLLRRNKCCRHSFFLGWKDQYEIYIPQYPSSL